VRLGKFDRDRSITFVPPDGVFEIMTYRITENINLPFKVMPVVQEFGKERIEYSVKIKAIYDRTNFATNVVIKLPVPKNTATTSIYSVGNGKAKYEPDQSAIVWR
jgi:AP-2 complex subunit mu-1